MPIGLLGRKVAMTQIYDPAGDVIPVTVIQAGPCVVLQVKSAERDGYEAVQLGFLDKPRRLASRAQRGHVAKLDSKRQRSRGAAGLEAVAKAGCEPQRFVREFRTPVEGCRVGQQIKVDIFCPAGQVRGEAERVERLKELAKKHGMKPDQGDPEKVAWKKEEWEKAEQTLKEQHPEEHWAEMHAQSIPAVDVIGTSKGRGTAGAMKRHNYSGQRASHGVKKCHRHVGGIGCSADPSRTIRGKQMAGHYGNARSTVRNLKVVRVDVENNLLLVRGAVPGPNGGFVVIRHTNKLPGPQPVQAEEAKK
jgi:large subunit ribosomal protein L3